MLLVAIVRGREGTPDNTWRVVEAPAFSHWRTRLNNGILDALAIGCPISALLFEVSPVDVMT